MARAPILLTPLETMLPSVDFRNAGRSSIIDGRNFLVDSKGPYSGFTTKQLTPFPLAKPTDVESLRIQGRTLVFTGDAILTWRRDPPYTWELLYQFSSDIPSGYRNRWSAIFLEGMLYLAHPYRGVFRSPIDSDSDKLWLRPISDTDVPGLIPYVRGMAVVHGRPIVVSNDTIQWGGVGNFIDFTPALAGAGFQLLSAFVQGDYLGLSSFEDGFVVWTTGGQVVAEYIGGDGVWDIYPIVSQEQPISNLAMARLENGGITFLSRKGLMISGNNSRIEPFSPEFNEYFLGYMESSETDFAARQSWRVDYDSKREMLYLSESLDGISYSRSFVFHPTRNKWGLLSNRHYGALSPAEGIFGYVDSNGYVQYIDEYAGMREVTPPATALLNRHYPRVEKQMIVPSSSMVSHAREFDSTQVMSFDIIPKAAWYVWDEVLPTPAIPGSMDSWIEIGFVRPPDIAGTTLELFEIQEMSLGSYPSSPNWPVDYTTEHKQDVFYPAEEDLDSPADVTTEDIYEDWNLLDGEDNWLLAQPDSIERWNDLVNYVITYDDPDEVEDLETESGTEDLHGQNMNLIPMSYDVSWLGSLDGITFDEVVPTLARFTEELQVWTGMSSGQFHRIRISADAWPARYHAHYVALAVQFAGRLA